MTLNDVMALILHYFTEFVYDVQMSDVVIKKVTFATSSPDEFLVHATQLSLVEACQCS